jgi:lysine 6-dehydrogenase
LRFLVLGAGRMGLGAAFDLVHNSGHDVTLVDADRQNLEETTRRLNSSRVEARFADVSDEDAAVELMRGHDAVISCVVYRLNLLLARAAIRAGTHFCDLGGNNDVVDAELALHEEARAKGVNIVPDCGLAPGMVAVLAMHGAGRFDSIDEIRIRVGGLPQKPKPPLNYQMVFSVEGLINEYVEPARVMREGRITTVASMTEVESLEFREPYGMMEAFQTSGGTSTLPQTFLGKIRELDYKTIRYPGHCEKFRTMLDLGLGSSAPVEIGGVSMAPRRLFAKLLVDNLPHDEPDVVLVRLDFTGQKEGKSSALRYEIIDEQDEATGLSAMMRTTAFPASIVAQMMARGETLSRGALPQERCIPPELFVAELAKRRIVIEESGRAAEV